MQIGDRIKALRKEEGMTQKELAQRAGISRSYLADTEANRYNPSIETLGKIAEALSVPVSALLSDSEPEKTGPQYVLDDETMEYLDDLRKRPEMRTLFSVSQKATKEDVERAVEIIKALKRQSGK